MTGTFMMKEDGQIIIRDEKGNSIDGYYGRGFTVWLKGGVKFGFYGCLELAMNTLRRNQ